MKITAAYFFGLAIGVFAGLAYKHHHHGMLSVRNCAVGLSLGVLIFIAERLLKRHVQGRVDRIVYLNKRR